MKPTLDQISAEITQLMIDTEKNEQALQPLVLKIWAAFDEAKERRVSISIEGATYKTAWTKLPGKPKMRYCQYLVRDGSRKRDANDDTHSVRVTVNLDKATHAILDGVRREISDKKLNGNVLTVTLTAVPKEDKEAEPIKHARFNSFSTWCSKDAAHSNMARAKTQATCPFCLAALAAGIQVENPVSERRRVEGRLRDARKTLQRHEEMVANCLPEHQDQYRYKTAVESIPKERAEVAELEEKLAIARLIETPEQAVEAAKAKQAEREAERARLAALPRHILHPQPPKGEELTLCGEKIIQDETQVTWSQHIPATCPACIEQSKQIGLGVKIADEDEHKEYRKRYKKETTGTQAGHEAGQVDVPMPGGVN
jgi:hypothetical protein